jgi:hypothetical protein
MPGPAGVKRRRVVQCTNGMAVGADMNEEEGRDVATHPEIVSGLVYLDGLAGEGGGFALKAPEVDALPDAPGLLLLDPSHSIPGHRCRP